MLVSGLSVSSVAVVIRGGRVSFWRFWGSWWGGSLNVPHLDG